MTIIQLEYFLAVVNYGSFSAASEYCFVTQPSLSIQISNLEDELGMTLLNRNNKPITPTEAGKAVLEQARLTVAAFYGTKERVNELRGDLAGKVRLSVIPTISPFLMPLFIPEFTKRCPQVELEIIDMFTADIIDNLSRDMTDIAILSGGETDIKIPETLLFEEKLYLYVSKNNKLYNYGNKIFIEDIDVKELLLLSEGNCLRNQVLRLCRARRRMRAPYNFRNCSLETLMHVVDNSTGITIIPSMAIGFIPEEKRKQIKSFGRNGAYRKITMAVGHTFVKESIINAVQESIMVAKKQFEVSEFLVP